MVIGDQRHVPAALSPGKRSGTHCSGGWVGLGAGLGEFRESHRHLGLNPGPSNPWRFDIPTMLSRPTNDL